MRNDMNTADETKRLARLAESMLESDYSGSVSTVVLLERLRQTTRHMRGLQARVAECEKAIKEAEYLLMEEHDIQGCAESLRRVLYNE